MQGFFLVIDSSAVFKTENWIIWSYPSIYQKDLRLELSLPKGNYAGLWLSVINAVLLEWVFPRNYLHKHMYRYIDIYGNTQKFFTKICLHYFSVLKSKHSIHKQLKSCFSSQTYQNLFLHPFLSWLHSSPVLTACSKRAISSERQCRPHKSLDTVTAFFFQQGRLWWQIT